MKNDLYVLAHEMKNPLCVVKGYLEMMDEKNFSRYKEIINEEIDASIQILNNYLNYNKLNIEKEEMDLNILLLDVKRSMKEFLLKKHVRLIIDFHEEDVYLLADYNKLKEVFYNILKNSVEWQSQEITISYQEKDNKIEIMIMNDGEKIKEEVLDKIDDGISFNVLGNGIGLNLSKKIINLHGGTIQYVNNDNRGISTIITLNKK